jgi:2-polyprenyl-3-methyl-5-hydroxy-6-metoxy-1,4-benzoquinol methylase
MEKEMKSVDLEECPLCRSKIQNQMYKDFQDNNYVKCSDCTLVFQNPRVLTEYEDSYWEKSFDPDGNERILMNERDEYLRNRFVLDLKFLKKIKPGKILDAGAGFGFFLSALSSEWEKHALELSDFCVDYMKNHYPEIQSKSQLLEEADYPDNTFDVIYSHHVMEHVENPIKVMESMSRMLKPGGLMIVGVPNIESFVAKRFKGNYRLLGSPHILMWSKKTLTKLLSLNGLNVFKDVYPYFGSDYVSVKNLIRLFDKSKISPPFYGNSMTLYAKKIK